MRRIPLPLREKMAKNPFMAKCAYPDCYKAPEWEHAWEYARRQINEEWAIVPVCTYHHRLKGLNKDFNRWVALKRATKEDLTKYPKKNWIQELMKLNPKFSEKYNIKTILMLDSYSKEKQ